MASKTESKRAALKATMLEEVDVLLEEYLDWYEEREDFKFRDLEVKLLQLRKEMSAKLAEVVIREKEKGEQGVKQCPTCGRELRYKGGKEKTVVSLVGEVPVKRGYYYCPPCQSGHFPPGQPTGDEIDME